MIGPDEVGSVQVSDRVMGFDLLGSTLVTTSRRRSSRRG